MSEQAHPSENTGSPVADEARRRPAGAEFAGYDRLPPPTRIAQQLRRMEQLGRGFSAHLAHALSCNPTDLAAMQHLIVSGPMSPGELSRSLGVTSAAGSMVVDRLVGLGHVQREPHEADRRRTVVHPTKASVDRAIDELVPVVSGVNAVIAELSEEQRRTVEDFLERVNAVYADAIAVGERTSHPDRSVSS